MNHKEKIVSKKSLINKVKSLRKANRIAFTNGCFDIIHYGHIQYLQKAKGKGRILVVGINSDASVRKIKGAGRPIVKQRARAQVLAALECVDYVAIFNEDTPLNLIRAVKPDILIKGADWRAKGVVGSDIIKEHGGKVEFIKFAKGFSSTKLAKKIEKL